MNKMEEKEKIIKKIVQLAFDDASQKVNSVHKTVKARHIIDVLDDKKIVIGVKSLIRLYDKYIEGKKISTKESERTINIMCVYLGYENYADFVIKSGYYKNQFAKNEDNPNNKEKITKVEVTNLDDLKIEVKHTKKKTSYILPFILAILSIVIVGIGINQYNKKQTNQITINNFNANKNYYYYTTPQGRIELTDNPNIQNVKPLTYPILNTYLVENKIDTTSEDIKLIKAQYYDHGWKNKPLEKEVNTKQQTIPKIKNSIKQIPEKQIKKPNATPQTSKKKVTNHKTLWITVKSENGIDKPLEKKLFQKFKNDFSINNSSNSNYQLKGNSQYSFTESNMTKDRVICTLTLNYSIINTKTNTLELEDTKQVKGTGFSKEAAKQNTINKLKL